MNATRDAGNAALRRVGRSLVSWWEIPPRSALDRGDFVRFAHGIATLARQLVAAASGLAGLPPSWRGPWPSAPEGFGERLAEMTSLASPTRSADLAETLTEEMLTLMERAGVPEVAERLGRWTYGPLPPEITPDRVRALAAQVFERARSHGALAVVIADSWARRCADNASDVDIRLVVEVDPALDDRRALVAPFARGAIRQYGDEAYITADQFAWSGRRIDVKYHSLGRLARALSERFVLGGAIDLLELVAVHETVADPTGAMARLSAQRDRLQARAAEVADASLAALLEVPAEPPRGATAAQVMAATLGPELEYAARAWAGMNGRIHAFPKWLAALVPELARRPPDGWDRLQRIAAGPWTEDRLGRQRALWRRFVDDLAVLGRGIVRH